MAKKKILVVEDGEFNRDLMVQLLSEEYTVVVAVNGEEALKRAEQEMPDLILMDLGLPGVDGWEATKRIKDDPTLKHIPVIAVTSHAMASDRRKAQAMGCDDYLAKPIDETDLRRKIEKLI